MYGRALDESKQSNWVLSVCERTSTKVMDILGYIDSLLVGSTYLIKTTAGGGRQKHDKEDSD